MSLPHKYQNDTGMTVRYDTKHLHPLTHTSDIRLVFSTSATGGLDMDVQRRPPLTPLLSASDCLNIVHVIEHVRKEQVRLALASKEFEVQKALLFMLEALQIRMNQHWVAAQKNQNVSLEDLMGILTVKNEGVAEGRMMELMKALEIDNEGQKDGGDIHTAAIEAVEKGADAAIADKGETEQLGGNEHIVQ